MNDCSLITAISGIACAIIKGSTDDEISMLSVIFSQLGDTLATYLTQKEICANRQAAKDKNQKDKGKDSNVAQSSDSPTENADSSDCMPL